MCRTNPGEINAGWLSKSWDCPCIPSIESAITLTAALSGNCGGGCDVHCQRSISALSRIIPPPPPPKGWFSEVLRLFLVMPLQTCCMGHGGVDVGYCISSELLKPGRPCQALPNQIITGCRGDTSHHIKPSQRSYYDECATQSAPMANTYGMRQNHTPPPPTLLPVDAIYINPEYTFRSIRFPAANNVYLCSWRDTFKLCRTPHTTNTAGWRHIR